MTKFSCKKCSWWIATSDIIQCCAECGSSEVIAIFEGEENEETLGKRADPINSCGNNNSDLGSGNDHSCGETIDAV